MIAPESTLTSPGIAAETLSQCRNILSALMPEEMLAKLRVGLIYREAAGWAAQASFLQMFASSLQSVALESRLEIGIISARGSQGQCNVPPSVPGGRWFMLPAAGGKSSLENTVAFHNIKVIVDLFDVSQAVSGIGMITWIPDFQSHRLPHFFTETEHKARLDRFDRQVQVSQVILLSSQAAKADCELFAPAAATMAAVVPFPSSHAFGPSLPIGDPTEIVRLYHLPEKFLLVANQYWAHKNHQAVIDAVALIAKQGIHVPVVMTGLPADYRNPANSPTSHLLQTIAKAGLAGQVVPLGQVPFAHLIALMRCAAAIVQPSRFEGWSTVVEDAKALGRPLICSGIEVHREQAPGALGFFDCDEPQELAEIILRHWAHLAAGPNFAGEEAALATERHFARQHGLRLASLCHQAFNLACAGPAA